MSLGMDVLLPISTLINNMGIIELGHVTHVIMEVHVYPALKSTNVYVPRDSAEPTVTKVLFFRTSKE